MDPKTQISPSDRMYEDFDPSFEWTRDQTGVTLLVRLPGFRRQDFKIVYTSVLSISGERMISEKKWLRFSKEISIPSDCDTKNNIMAAKFLNGVLHITFQRLISDPEPQEITKMTPSEKKEEAPRPQKEPIIKPQLPKEDSQKEMTQYEDFEPHFEWSRDAKNATLLVKLPGFSKEHLKNIEFTSVLSISGEREITETKRLRFNKQISIPSDCDSDKMRAKLQNGVLSVTFPLLPTPPTEPQEITKMPPAEESPSDAKATEKENDSVIKTTERKEEKEVITKASLPEDASRRAPAKAEPEEKKKAPKDPRLQPQVLMPPEEPTKGVDKQKVAEEVPPKPREDKAEVKTNGVSGKTPQKEKETAKTKPKEVSQEIMKPTSEAQRIDKQKDAKEVIPAKLREEKAEVKTNGVSGKTPQKEKETAKTKPKEVSQEIMKPSSEAQRIDKQKDAEEVIPAKLREEKAEVKSNEVSEKIPEKEKETTIKTPEEASQSGEQKLMKPQETTKQPEAAPSTQKFDQQKIAQAIISKPKEDKAEAKSSEILKDIPQKEKEPSSTKEEEKAEKVAEKQGDKMITKAKTRILDFTVSLRSNDKDDKEVLGGLKKPQWKKLIVAILLVVVLGLYVKNAFRSTSNHGGSEFQEL